MRCRPEYCHVCCPAAAYAYDDQIGLRFRCKLNSLPVGLAQPHDTLDRTPILGIAWQRRFKLASQPFCLTFKLLTANNIFQDMEKGQFSSGPILAKTPFSSPGPSISHSFSKRYTSIAPTKTPKRISVIVQLTEYLNTCNPRHRFYPGQPVTSYGKAACGRSRCPLV